MWICRKCGACCEILPLKLFGKECEHYDKKTKLCKIYETRPEICIIKHHLGEDITEILCKRLREMREKCSIEYPK